MDGRGGLSALFPHLATSGCWTPEMEPGQIVRRMMCRAYQARAEFCLAREDQLPNAVHGILLNSADEN